MSALPGAPAKPPVRRWTAVGLAIALFGMPLVVGLFNALEIPVTTPNVLLREIAVFACAGALALVIRRKERLGWDSVGLQRPRLGQTALWAAITLVAVAAALALALGVCALCGWKLGNSSSARAFEALPLWVVFFVVLRAGFVEEFFYRGYALERMKAITGNRLVAVGLPLFLFAVFHYRQGWAGITVALFTGAALTAMYLWKRNLWATIVPHFLVDLIPNVLVPLVAAAMPHK